MSPKGAARVAGSLRSGTLWIECDRGRRPAPRRARARPVAAKTSGVVLSYEHLNPGRRKVVDGDPGGADGARADGVEASFTGAAAAFFGLTRGPPGHSEDAEAARTSGGKVIRTRRDTPGGQSTLRGAAHRGRTVSISELDAWLQARVGPEGEARGRRLGATADGDKPWRGTTTSRPDAPLERRLASPTVPSDEPARRADASGVGGREGAALVAEPPTERARPTRSPAERGGGSGGGSARVLGAQTCASGVRPLVLVGFEVEGPDVAVPPRREGKIP